MRRNAADRPTRHVRLAEDLADMLAEIVRHGDGRTAAEILDPMVRGPIGLLYDPIRPLVEAIAAARAHHRTTHAPA